MSIMVKNLYKNGSFLYKMNLIAGKNGMDNLVQWVHIIEDDNVTSFLHGNELVFTAGILNSHKEWLLNFARKLYETRVSAFVVNIGPHTKDISAEVVAYCDEVGMPLFTIPWETKMVDMTRDFCHRIMNNEHVEHTIATKFKNIIFNIGDIDAQFMQMERYGYQRGSQFRFIAVGVSGADMEEYKDALKLSAETIAKNIHDLFISFSYQNFLMLVLVNYSPEETETFVSRFTRVIKQELKGAIANLGISSVQEGIYNQNTNFEKAISALEMARKRGELYSYYDKLGIYKVLYAVGDKDVLRSYYHEVIGKLESYDRENHTQLTQLLRAYLENDGSLKLVSEEQYVHRNTVTNQLKKIEKIIGYDPLLLEDKVKLFMGFYIRDIL